MFSPDKTLTSRAEQQAENPTATLTLPLVPAKVARALFAFVLVFSGFNFLLQLYLYNAPGFPGLNTLIRFFGVDSERSIPTWYNSVLLFLCSLTLYAIFVAERKRQARQIYGWLGLAIIFLAMSIDETIAFYEDVGTIIQQATGLSGALYFAWVVPAAVFVLVVGAVYLRFLLELPPKTRLLILVAGLLYIGGALGLELTSAYHFELRGPDTLRYAFLTTLEEGLELSGAVLFLYALLDYLTKPGLTRRS